MDRGETKVDGGEHQASLFLLSNVRDVSSGQPASGSRIVLSYRKHYMSCYIGIYPSPASKTQPSGPWHEHLAP
jgi:hypothetical protein